MFKPKVEVISTVNDWSNIKIRNNIKDKEICDMDELSKDTNTMIRKWNMANVAQALHVAKNNNSNYKLLSTRSESSIIPEIKNDVYILYSYLSISSAVFNFKIPKSMCFIYDEMLPIYNKYLYENRLLELNNIAYTNSTYGISTISNYIKNIGTVDLSKDYFGDKLDQCVNRLYTSVGFRNILTSMSYGDTLPNFYVLKEMLGDWLGMKTKYITDNQLKKLLTCVFKLMGMKIPASYLFMDLEVRDWTYDLGNNNATY